MYQVKSEAGFAEILLYDEIGSDGINARDVVSFLSGNALNDIKLRINSQGGDLSEALAMHNYLKSLGVHKTVYIDGICASAASVIAMCGDRIIMPVNALFMIHNPWCYCQGDSNEMRETAERLDKVRESCVSVFMARTNLTHDEIIAMMNAETWMNGQEAKAKGFVDEVAGEVHDKVKDAYEAGVKAERERLRELDELMSAGRAEIITRAKYETFAKAGAIAIELLKNETGQSERYTQRLKNMKLDTSGLEYITQGMPVIMNEVDEGVKKINRMRGYAV